MKFEEYKNKLLKEDKEFAKAYFNKENDFAFDVSNLITEARLHAGLTQAALAKKIGTTQPAIARIERGLALPSLSFLQKIAKALGTYLVAPKFGFMEEGRGVAVTTGTQEVSVEIKPESLLISPYSNEGGMLVDDNNQYTGQAGSMNKLLTSIV